MPLASGTPVLGGGRSMLLLQPPAAVVVIVAQRKPGGAAKKFQKVFKDRAFLLDWSGGRGLPIKELDLDCHL
jgi:hypothetical protein